jgi:hypothetical protein
MNNYTRIDHLKVKAIYFFKHLKSLVSINFKINFQNSTLNFKKINDKFMKEYN